MELEPKQLIRKIESWKLKVEVTDKADKKGDDKEDTQKVYNCNKTNAKEMKHIS